MMKNNKAEFNSERVPECRLSGYVEKADEKTIYYTDKFYLEMFRLSRDGGMTYAEAYRYLGFDTDKLGEQRATQAGYRAARYALERFCYEGDDSVINLEDEPSLKIDDLGISRVVKREFEADLSAREKFLSAVLNKKFPLKNSVSQSGLHYRPLSICMSKSLYVIESSLLKLFKKIHSEIYNKVTF